MPKYFHWCRKNCQKIFFKFLNNQTTREIKGFALDSFSLADIQFLTHYYQLGISFLSIVLKFKQNELHFWLLNKLVCYCIANKQELHASFFSFFSKISTEIILDLKVIVNQNRTNELSSCPPPPNSIIWEYLHTSHYIPVSHQQPV